MPPKRFPIMIRGIGYPCPSSIPWEAIAPYEGQAKFNHDQTLERLAERGGLDPVEAFFVMNGHVWRGVPLPVSSDLERRACFFLDDLVRSGMISFLAKKRDEAVALLELWMNPLNIECSVPAHGGNGCTSCTCRNVEIAKRTREFLSRRDEP
jgi:hypothetical protein